MFQKVTIIWIRSMSEIKEKKIVKVKGLFMENGIVKVHEKKFLLNCIVNGV